MIGFGVQRTAAWRVGALASRAPLRLWPAAVGPRTGLLHTTAAARAGGQPAGNTAVAPADPTLPGLTLTFFQKAKGYLAFYKQGVKALWQNGKAAGGIRQRLKDGSQVTRAEFQIHQRHPGDRLRLVPFGLLLVVFPEIIPLLAALFPKACPSTCVTYAQVVKMAAKQDARRQALHRQALQRIEAAGLGPSDFATVAALQKAVARGNALFALDGLDGADLRLLCGFMGAGGPAAGLRTEWLRGGLRQHLEKLAADDALLAGEKLVARLGPVELHRACQERGIPSAHIPEPRLRQALGGWVDLTQTSRTSIGMLPIAWSRLVLLSAAVKQ
ncbi:hypothetical protein LPJ61_003302 [Coemansia biformis]|uniref:Letm1 RBD domain-containing protein n=1 Tax=Coemansia biformis TaxID=1286918 RepID=A0A9W7YDA7_9FUNG|nr:hypothetical protein LPJ61_003302 [Coemansia biformis]